MIIFVWSFFMMHNKVDEENSSLLQQNNQLSMLLPSFDSLLTTKHALISDLDIINWWKILEKIFYIYKEECLSVLYAFGHCSKCPIQKVSGCDRFLNNLTTEEDRDVRFSLLDTRDSRVWDYAKIWSIDCDGNVRVSAYAFRHDVVLCHLHTHNRALPWFGLTYTGVVTHEKTNIGEGQCSVKRSYIAEI